MAEFLKSGTFTLGVNYWTSHAGTNMWSDWRPDIVDRDLEKLAGAGIRTLRVFPLWPVFQPITQLYGGSGIPREITFGEESLPETEAGKAGMCSQALDKFAKFCEIATKHDIQLVIGLLTGWMSGRLYVPPALDGMNVLTDPRAIIWEVRFVRHFVQRFKEESVIVAWDLGNECNCMAPVNSAEEFYGWTSQIVGAILAKDNSRPIISGMHSLLPDNNWMIQHQGELTDFLTTHPYPYFTPHCDMDPIDTIRTGLHATSESLFYRGIGGKPCFVEECGTLGPMFADEETAADFVRSNLFTLWSHDCRGFFWWCANEQSHLTHPPYNWNSVERQLGLFRCDMSRKPVVETMSKFGEFMSEAPLLPPRIVDGVCILTRGQDTWGAAYMSFILAKQAGMDLEFTYSDQPLPEANLYIIPSICGDASFTGAYFRELMDKVEKGATLYLSMETGLLSPFEEVFGVRVLNRRKFDAVDEITLQRGDNESKGFTIPIHVNFKLKTILTNAKALAWDSVGDSVFTVSSYGKGKMYFLSYPLEIALTKVSDAFSMPYYHHYQTVLGSTCSGKVAQVENANIGLTEHIVGEEKRILVLVNYDPVPAQAKLNLNQGWDVAEFLYGSLEIGKNDAAVLVIRQK